MPPRARTTTTFDGAGGPRDARDVAAGAGRATAGRTDERDLAVEQAQREEGDDQEPDDRRDRGDASEPTGPTPYGSAARAAGAGPASCGRRPARRRRRRTGPPTRRRPSRGARPAPRRGSRAGASRSPPNVPADQPGDDVEPVALVDDLGEVGPAERDPVEDVQVAAQRELAVAAVRGPDPGDGQAEHRDERLRVARAARRQAARARAAARSRRRAPGAPGRSRSGTRGSGGAAARGQRQEPLAERVPALGRRSRSRRRRRGRRTG